MEGRELVCRHGDLVVKNLQFSRVWPFISPYFFFSGINPCSSNAGTNAFTMPSTAFGSDRGFFESVVPLHTSCPSGATVADQFVSTCTSVSFSMYDGS